MYGHCQDHRGPTQPKRIPEVSQIPAKVLRKINDRTNQPEQPKSYLCVKLERAMDYDAWYRSEYPRVLAAVTVVCGASSPRVEDATTDAFVKALERWDSVSAMDSPTGWVTRVAINGARRSFRRAGRLSELLNAERLEAVFSDSYKDADLIAALSKLSYRQRRAVVLHHVDGHTQAEVAQELDIAPGTASATLSQARKKLRVELEPNGEPA